MRVTANARTRATAARGRSRFLLFIKLFVAGATLVTYSAMLVLLGMAIYSALQKNSPASVSNLALRAVPTRLIASARNHWTFIRRNEPLERLHLDIKFKHLEKLRAKRLEAQEAGVLIASDNDFVPATIRTQGRSIRTRIRLKGDALDHLSGDKWSFRVKVKKNDQIFGMRRFSLQAPGVRDYQAEPIFLSHLRREGILTPRFLFVDVTVNGKDIGVMAVEEHFSKELLESQQRREGVILRFDESAFWNNLSLNGTFGPYGNPHISMLKPFRGSKVASSPALTADLEAAVGLMRGFMAGRLTAAEVFDVELMSRFMAVAEVWRTHHPLAWHNMRFYFNPLTARLEPIGFDGNVQGVPQEPGLVATSGGFTPMLLADDEFRAVFTRSLARIAADMADGTIAAWARPQENELLPKLQEGLEYIEPIRLESLMNRARNLASIDPDHFDLFLRPLGDSEMQYPEPLKAYLCGNCASPRIEFVNTLPVPVLVLSMELSEKRKAPTDMTLPVIRADFPLELPATGFMQAAKSVFVEFDSAADLEHFEVDVVVRVAAQTQRHTIRAQPYYRVLDASPLPSTTLEQALSRHSFLSIAEDGEGLFVRQGKWDVSSPLVIPTGLGLTLTAGTELRFGEEGILVSSGPLRFEGTKDQPIRLAPRSGVATWGGIVSLRSDTPHKWSHVVIEATSGIPSHTGWRLTGGVTLRAAEVQISNSKFIGNRAEDALNLIRSRFELEGVEFHDTASDALDADFSDGIIRGGRFSQIGGDGIDVSGANIEVDGTLLVDIADKAISVGEASRLVARNVRIERVGTGAASKDASEFTFEDSFIGDAMTAGVSVYTKKPVYGPAQASLQGIEMHNVGTDVLVQLGNIATVDGVSVAEQPFDTDSLY